MSSSDRYTQEQLELFLLEGLDSGEAVPVTPEFWRMLWGRINVEKQERKTRSLHNS